MTSTRKDLPKSHCNFDPDRLRAAMFSTAHLPENPAHSEQAIVPPRTDPSGRSPIVWLRPLGCWVAWALRPTRLDVVLASFERIPCGLPVTVPGGTLPHVLRVWASDLSLRIRILRAKSMVRLWSLLPSSVSGFHPGPMPHCKPPTSISGGAPSSTASTVRPPSN